MALDGSGTSWKANEARGQDGERRLEALFARAPVGLAEISLDGRFVQVNDEFCRLLGRPHAQLLALGVADVTHPEDLPASLVTLSEVMRTGAPGSLDKRYVRPDGESVWTRSSLTLVDDGQGGPQTVLAVTVDLTERTRAEQALRRREAATHEAQEYLAFVLEAFDAAEYELDLATHLLRPSPRLNLLYGYPPDHPLTLADCQARYHPDDRAMMQSIIPRAVSEGQRRFEHELRILLPDGGTRWVLTRGKVQVDAQGRPERVRGAAIDITGRKEAEGALKASELKYRSLFDTMDEGVFLAEVLFDAEDRPFDIRYLEANPAATRMVGQQYAGRRLTEIDPTFEAHWFVTFGQVARTGEPARLEQYAEPLQRWFDFYVFKVGDAEGRRVAVIFQDVTERRRRVLNAAFLAEVGQTFARFSTPDELLQAVSVQLAHYFAASSRLWVGELDEAQETVVASYDYHATGLPDIRDTHQLAELLSAALLPELRAGRVVAVDDLRADPRTAEAAASLTRGVRSQLLAPYVNGGRLRFVIAVQHAAPHAWRADEVELLHELAGRIYRRVERARAEQALRESEAQFRAVAELVPEMLWRNDPTGAIQWFNQRWLDYTGQTLEDACGYGWLDALHPDDRNASLQAFQSAIDAGKPLHLEYRVCGVDGRFRWFLVRAEPVRDEAGAIVEWFGAATDIQEQRDALEALQASEERLRLVLATVRNYAIITLDPDGRIVDWNAGAEQLFGYGAEELLGQSGELIFTPEDRAAGVPAREQQMALAAGNADDERWHVCKDGTRFFASGVVSPVRDASGQLRWFVKVLQDLTAERQAAAALQAAHDTLEARVRERTAALAATNEALQDEIVQRLRAEQARQQALRQLVSAQEEERRRLARELHDQLGQQITGLLLGLKELEAQAGNGPLAGRIRPLHALTTELASESHRLAVSLRPAVLDDFGLLPALERLVEQWAAQAPPMVALHSSGLDGARLPPALETVLYRVVQEALTNVWKHAQAHTVAVLIERHEGEVRAIIEDDGRGFDPTVPAIGQVARPSMGVVGMRERVVQVGGTLELESSGSGTTLFVRLPFGEPEAGS